MTEISDIMMAVKLKYETGIATVIQFIVLGLLNIVDGFNSVITTCNTDNSSCLSNLFVSIIFFLLIMCWFAFICLLGFMAQEKRSKRFAQALIGAEALVAIVAIFNIKHHDDFLSLFTSVADLLLAIWISTLAFRLMRSGGKRITGQRSRRRPSTINRR